MMIHLLKRIAPDWTDRIETRLSALSWIAAIQPVGRRQLASHMALPERDIRSAAEHLREAGLIETNAAGMKLTPEGAAIVAQAQALYRELRGLASIEADIARRYGVRRVLVAPGDCDETPGVFLPLGRAGAAELRGSLQPGWVVAITGGSTVASLVHEMPESGSLGLTVLPARGGIGGNALTQASTLAQELARRVGGVHRMLHLPDDLPEPVAQALLQQPSVRETIALLEGADLLICGIGNAEESMRRRELGAEQTRLIRSKHPLAEAFGVFFAADGTPVYRAGMLADFTGVRTMMAVAGGRNKAAAIAAVLRSGRIDTLITDEGAAKRLL